jgi:hypothetical protein
MKINHGAVWIVASISVAAAAAHSPSAQQIAAQLTANGLKADVSFLASDALQGRGTPSPGLDIAAEFIAAQFRGIGLDPAGDDGYFQTAAFASVTPNPDGAQLTFEIAGQTIAVDKAAFSVAEPAALDLQHAAVYLATSASLASLADLPVDQVRGKVLIIEAGGRMPRLQLATVMRLQPVLLIGVVNNPVRPLGAGMPRLRDASAPVLPSVTVWDKAVFEALANAKPGPLDATVSAHIAAPKSEPLQLRNVVGVLRGSDPALANTYVLVTAHYDHLGVRGTGAGYHIYNGANDDASGTASVIEIARALASGGARPKRSIVFVALFGEEMGLLGSRYYAQHPVVPLKSTVADLNLEQMGRTDDNTGPRVGIVNATGFDYTNITGVLAKAGQEFGIQVLKDDASSDPFYARSDNQAFADAGVPSHTLSVGYVYPDYHQPGDEWPKLDYENMAKVDRAVALALFRIADSIEPPQWNLANPKTAPYIKAR